MKIRINHLALFFIIVLPLFIFNCNGSKKASDTTKSVSESGLFMSSKTLTKVLEEAQKKGKIVFVDVYTTWCTPCKVMDQEVYTHPSVMKFLKDNMINYKVDAEKGNGPDLGIIYGVQVYPTLLFLDDKGREIVRNDGGLSTTAFLELAQQALDLR